MYVHPDAQLVEIIDGEEFYSCDPIGFSNYMISRNWNSYQQNNWKNKNS